MLEATHLDKLLLPAVQVGYLGGELLFGVALNLRISDSFRLRFLDKCGGKLELLDDFERVEKLVGGLRVQEAVPIFSGAFQLGEIVVELAVDWQFLEEIPHRLCQSGIVLGQQREELVEGVLLGSYQEFWMGLLVVRLVGTQVNVKTHVVVFDVAVIIFVWVDEAALHLHVEFIQLQSEYFRTSLPDGPQAFKGADVDARLHLATLSSTSNRNWPRVKVGILQRELLELGLDWFLALVPVEELDQTLY
jgi:hypothetical protein